MCREGAIPWVSRSFEVGGAPHPLRFARRVHQASELRSRSRSALFPLPLLHAWWASARLFGSSSAPPFESGSMWSTVGACGCPGGSVLSTGRPHRWQMSLLRRTRSRARRQGLPVLPLERGPCGGTVGLRMVRAGCAVQVDGSLLRMVVKVFDQQRGRDRCPHVAVGPCGGCCATPCRWGSANRKPWRTHPSLSVSHPAGRVRGRVVA